MSLLDWVTGRGHKLPCEEVSSKERQDFRHAIHENRRQQQIAVAAAALSSETSRRTKDTAEKTIQQLVSFMSEKRDAKSR